VNDATTGTDSLAGSGTNGNGDTLLDNAGDAVGNVVDGVADGVNDVVDGVAEGVNDITNTR
jgi:hypothetical protein